MPLLVLRLFVPLGLNAGILACSGMPGSSDLETAPKALVGWHGVDFRSVGHLMGSPVTTTNAEGRVVVRYTEYWVVGVAGERYKVPDGHYPIKGQTDGAGASPQRGGFNASLTQCILTFELLTSGLVDKAWHQGRDCPVPAQPMPSATPH